MDRFPKGSYEHTISHVSNSMPLTAIVSNDYHFISSLDEALTQLVDMHFNSTSAGVEEVTNHRNYWFLVIHSSKKYPVYSNRAT